MSVRIKVSTMVDDWLVDDPLADEPTPQRELVLMNFESAGGLKLRPSTISARPNPGR